MSHKSDFYVHEVTSGEWITLGSINKLILVYIYNSRPDSQILYKMGVIAVNLTSNETMIDREYWVNPSDFDISLNLNRFFRMILLAENETDKLTLTDLLEHGLKGVPQAALRVKEPLLSYLLETL